MNKVDLVDVVYRLHGGISRQEASELVDTIIARLKSGMNRSGEVHLAGFGSFEVVPRGPRNGRNPKTGEPMALPAHNTLVFRPSRLLIDRLNHSGPAAGESPRA